MSAQGCSRRFAASFSMVLSLLVGAAAAQTASPTFAILVSFDGSNGLVPAAPLTQGTDGELYGTTDLGGGNGNVFRITTSGVLTNLNAFCSQVNCTGPAAPHSPLIQAPNGRFYGASEGGGTEGNGGTFFEMAPWGALTVLHSFCFSGTCAEDGNEPAGALIQSESGNFYGTALRGNTLDSGTIFEITPEGTLSTLYKFCSQANCTDGANPFGLVEGNDGNFYGTTIFGGTYGSGEVFRTTPYGALTVLYSFGSDGAYPNGIVLANDGNFYGTTSSGGAGTVFTMSPGGRVTTLYHFCSRAQCADGSEPAGTLVQATDGNLYGVTYQGGKSNNGIVFEITPSGVLTTLHAFDSTHGSAPAGGLVQATDGSVYGTTSVGGTYNSGTVFKLSLGLSAFVETQTSSGPTGSSVTILGTNLNGATSVAFNGAAAAFTVVSRSEITATIPSGATTGLVVVTTPNGTLKSNKKFRITP